ncbi:hypothetical protein BKA62DRAFT_773577 [Auriculariales sp. MPI-PUGE-AT-0066]|nr:hypothetical protein BKA62DRAFT_773577 [Auriculariales sp. MPI-PUGE-AT-0066]
MPAALEHTAGTSKSYKVFTGAYRSIAENSTRWTMEDFAACFPSFCADAPEQAAELRTHVGQVIAKHMMQHGQHYLDLHNAGPAIDALHEAAAAANQRDPTTPPPKDGWRPDLEPRVIARARVVPILRQERDRRLKLLQELEAENNELAARVEVHAAAKATMEAQLTKRLDALDAAVKKFAALPSSDIEQWTRSVLDQQPLHSGRAAEQPDEHMADADQSGPGPTGSSSASLLAS